jgi:hypothetical protein
MKVAFEKYKNHIDISAWFKCVIVAFGLIIIAYLIQLSNSLLFSSSVSVWVKGVYYVGLTFIIGTIVWLAIYISPRVLRSLITTSPVETKPAQTQQATPSQPETKMRPAQDPVAAAPKTEAASEPQVKWIPVYPEAPAAHEESESEKLRREFRNRTL